MEKALRAQLAEKRIRSILARQGIATARTLEQKISDAGPNNQRIDPHVLTGVRNSMVTSGELVRENHYNAPWFRLGNADPALIEKRLNEIGPVYKAYIDGSLAQRIGQSLEIAAYRALIETEFNFFGRFKNFDAHDDSTLYQKEEPPQHIGRRSLSGNQRLDFLIAHADATVGMLGIECKNVREWLYPDREEVKETLDKCLRLDCVPVLIARRIPFVTFKLLSACGVICHQTYGQFVPTADGELVSMARHKDFLGYHDIKLGNAPDARLQKFIAVNLPLVASNARIRFDQNRDLLEGFVSEYSYAEFSGRLRRRLAGQVEDHDWEIDI